MRVATVYPLQNLRLIGKSTFFSVVLSKFYSNVLAEIIKTFTEVDQNSASIQTSGSTAACCLIRKAPESNSRTLFVANVGDTRAVLCTDTTAKRLTYDHTAADANEVKRIEGVGGFILRGRILGILSVARAIGDHALKKYVISQPYTTVTPLTGRERFLIVACDGVWDVFKDEEAADFIRTGLKSKAFTEQEAANKLVEAAVEKGSQDNITALVVFL